MWWNENNEHSITSTDIPPQLNNPTKPDKKNDCHFYWKQPNNTTNICGKFERKHNNSFSWSQ